MPNAALPAPPRRAALVTGAGRRIGAAIARALAEAGWHVHIHYHRSSREARSLAAAIREAGGAAAAIRADLARLDAAGARTLIRACAASGPPLAALVNNASLFAKDGFADFTAAGWARHQQVNLTAPLLLARAFAAAWRSRGRAAAIVNILDNKVLATNPDFFSYTISKQGLHAATATLAMALAPRIRVNAVAPGITLISGKQSVAGYERAHRLNPLRRGCTPEDIARAVIFLLDTPAITGQTVAIDGGAALARPPRDVAFL